ncbi:MAG: sensor histidine kinase [Desulfobulbaceae bacterium]|uniref:histidine kinase n=1 Tax=Candidatus Desulfobia pelagia TaxID=2841692 RepID=A0A8J6NF51_9BACT|nr:sensor histidine kinase [Candidatus Desulfobia pelagia]
MGLDTLRNATTGRKILFAGLIIITVVIGGLHHFTPWEFVFFHDTYRRLAYFPIVLGALFFGVTGGMVMAFLSSVAFIPHLMMFSGHGFEAYLSEFTEIFLYLSAGLLVGIITRKETLLRLKYKALSEKLEKSYDRLHKETEQLIEAEEQLALSQKMSELGRLSASLAHEIKNPLSSIRGTAEILMDDFPPDHPKHEFAEILLKETTRLNATVEDILSYSREQKGAVEATEPLASVIRRTITLLDQRLRDKSIQCVEIGTDQGDSFMVAGNRLGQVFLNILLNAMDAIDVGGKIVVRVAREKEGCQIAIEDNGPGLSDGEKKKIFEPFYSNKEEGTGLGLVISRKIVGSYGGTIEVTDAPGGGAAFTVFIPNQTGKTYE